MLGKYEVCPTYKLAYVFKLRQVRFLKRQSSSFWHFRLRLAKVAKQPQLSYAGIIMLNSLSHRKLVCAPAYAFFRLWVFRLRLAKVAKQPQLSYAGYQ